MSKTVYIVHTIDTEGPMYESLTANFERLDAIFGIKLAPSYETLKKLQNKEVDLQGKEDAVANMLAPKRLKMNETWDSIDAMLDVITSKGFREKYADSFGNGWVYNWFCMDHAGFNNINPRRRDIGYHNVYDHYKQYNQLNEHVQDMLQFHYHPLPIINDANRSGTTYLNSSNIYDILSRKVIDRLWFPSAYRPGFHTERPDSHWFLEQWIPFDYANQSVEGLDTDQPDLAEGRFGDWRRSPVSWIPYHPDFYDYQKKGNCKRYIARCLNMEARTRELKTIDVELAFQEAQTNGSSLLSFTNHDFRDMEPEIDKVWNMINRVAKKYSEVKFKHVNAIEGYRKVLKLGNLTPPDFNLSLEKNTHFAKLTVKAKGEIFGIQPYLAIKTHSQTYHYENFDFQPDNTWTYTFDYNNIDINAIEKLGIAANTPTGVTEVVVLDVPTGTENRKIYNA